MQSTDELSVVLLQGLDLVGDLSTLPLYLLLLLLQLLLELVLNVLNEGLLTVFDLVFLKGASLRQLLQGLLELPTRVHQVSLRLVSLLLQESELALPECPFTFICGL